MQLFAEVIIVTFGANNGRYFNVASVAGCGIDAAVQTRQGGSKAVANHAQCN